MKNCTKAIFFISKHFLSAENDEGTFAHRNVTLRCVPGPHNSWSSLSNVFMRKFSENQFRFTFFSTLAGWFLENIIYWLIAKCSDYYFKSIIVNPLGSDQIAFKIIRKTFYETLNFAFRFYCKNKHTIKKIETFASYPYK